jgi:FkbM family methyltransferase
MSRYRESVNLVEKWIAHSKPGLATAFKLRKFANAVIGRSFYSGLDFESTGEINLLKAVGHYVRTFMDIGANVGDWTGHLLKYAGSDAEGFLYEPSRSAMVKLNNRFGKNSRITLIRAAIGDRCGRTVFYEEPDARHSASIFKEVTKKSSKIEVPLTTLENEFDKHKISTLDMVKIDAEGYDGLILKGAENLISEHRIGIIQFEYNISWIHARFTLAEAMNLLESHGYAVYLLKQDRACVYDYKKYNEFFYYSIFIAVNPEKPEIPQSIIRADH